MLPIISCNCNTNDGIEIDLTQAKTSIRYSDFIDSVSYVTLFTHDSCIISGIKRIYTDGEYTMLTDEGGNGVSVFYKNKLITNIDNYGRGPQEFIYLSNFCLDKAQKHICIFDERSSKILRYNYDGTFVSSQPFEDVMRDFACIDKQFICIQPGYLKESPSGVWAADGQGNFGHSLLAGSRDNVFEDIYSKYFNLFTDGISYYDRYDNRLYHITPDSAYLKYSFNLIPAMPLRLKRIDKGLEDYFMLASCFDLPKHLLLFYHSTDQFYQVLFNKSDSTYQVTDNLINDLLPKNTISVSKHYNDNTLIIELGATETDYNVNLQILHAKK